MTSQGNNNVKPDKNLMIASKILDRNSSTSNINKNDDLYLKENNSSNQINNDHIFNPTSSITPYILLIVFICSWNF